MVFKAIKRAIFVKWTLETDTNMKIFSPYTIICVLALTETTLATSSIKSKATIVSERFHIKGLRYSDLTWFTRRRDLKYYLFWKSLITDLQIPDVFYENRVNLANYCLKSNDLKYEDTEEIVHLLFDLQEYEGIIELYCEEPHHPSIFILETFSEAHLDDFYEAIKVSPNRDKFFEVMAADEGNPLSVQMYSRAILDFHLPKELYMSALSKNNYILTQVVRFVMSRVKGNAEDVYGKIGTAFNKNSENLQKEPKDENVLSKIDFTLMFFYYFI